jgi:putative ABC transport system substrate-binding protein
VAGVARAQRRYRIGLLNTGSSSPIIDTFVNALGDLGYVEGKNVVIERRFAEGNANRLQEFAMGLVRLPVDVIVTMGTPAGFAAKQATTTIPLVFAANSEPPSAQERGGRYHLTTR